MQWPENRIDVMELITSQIMLKVLPTGE